MHGAFCRQPLFVGAGGVYLARRTVLTDAAMGKITRNMIATALKEFSPDDYHSGLAYIGDIHMHFGLPHDDYSFFKGKKVLDIGCGNSEGNDADDSRKFEPWLCRAFALCGAEPVGIDLGKNKSEEFPIYRRDISAKGALDFLESNSFDMVVCFFLLPPSSSPSLRKAVPNGLSGIYDYVVPEIHSQTLRVLKDGGFFFTDKITYQKINGELVEKKKG